MTRRNRGARLSVAAAAAVTLSSFAYGCSRPTEKASRPETESKVPAASTKPEPIHLEIGREQKVAWADGSEQAMVWTARDHAGLQERAVDLVARCADGRGSLSMVNSNGTKEPVLDLPCGGESASIVLLPKPDGQLVVIATGSPEGGSAPAVKSVLVACFGDSLEIGQTYSGPVGEPLPAWASIAAGGTSGQSDCAGRLGGGKWRTLGWKVSTTGGPHTSAAAGAGDLFMMLSDVVVDGAKWESWFDGRLVASGSFAVKREDGSSCVLVEEKSKTEIGLRFDGPDRLSITEIDGEKPKASEQPIILERTWGPPARRTKAPPEPAPSAEGLPEGDIYHGLPISGGG
jgi:hypothetical protein